MTDTIIRKGQPIPELLNAYGKHYFEELPMSYQMYQDSLRIVLLDDAMAAGKTCAEYVISTREFRGHSVDIMNTFAALAGEFTLPKVKAYLQSLKFKAGQYGHMELDLDPEGKIKVSLSYRESNRVYSPFALHRLNPLKEVPKKWTLAYVKRALANGQFKLLQCNGRYSDDYAYDAAVNFHKGPISALPLLEDLVTSPSGWWTSYDEATGRVNVCCHHFDSNSFILELNPGPPPTEAETEAEAEAAAAA